MCVANTSDVPAKAHRADADELPSEVSSSSRRAMTGSGLRLPTTRRHDRLLAEPHARVLRAADADAHDRGLAGEPALAELHHVSDEEPRGAGHPVGGNSMR